MEKEPGMAFIQKRLDEIIEVLKGNKKKRAFDTFDLIIAMIYVEVLKKTKDYATAEQFSLNLKKYIKS